LKADKDFASLRVLARFLTALRDVDVTEFPHANCGKRCIASCTRTSRLQNSPLPYVCGVVFMRRRSGTARSGCADLRGGRERTGPHAAPYRSRAVVRRGG
jgi:hypothetical protein